MKSRHMLAAAVSALMGAQATAADFGASWFFGDSLTDAGTFAPFLPPGTGRFTTNPGPVWAENLAAALGTTAAPVGAGGTNFAQGGARVTGLPGVPDDNPLTANALPVADQVAAHLGASGRADPGALYVVWAGANDLFVAIDPARPESADPVGYLSVTAGQTAALVGSLRAAGARFIVVPMLPDVGITPFGASLGPAGAAGITALSELYNRTLFGSLANAGVEVVPLDTFSLLREVTADPARYGFVNATLPACGATGSLVCTSADFVVPDADRTFVFADGVHPTTATHAALAQYALSVLRAPGAVSLLAESPLHTREVLHTIVREQIAQGDGARGQRGHNVWAALGGGRLEFSSSEIRPGADGNPYTLAAGVDTRLASGVVVGVALGLARLEADFSAGGGEYDQDERTLALYAAYRSGPMHATAVAAVGAADYDTRREIALGAARRAMKGDTTGSSLSLAVQAGYDFGAGPARHGPLVGLRLQQVEVDGFSERGSDSTTMSFGSQDRNALVGSLGYRARWDFGRYQPFMQAAVEHDFEDDDRDVRASLVTLPANSFALPAFEAGRTWGSAALGVGARFSPALSGSVALSGRFAQDDVRSYALQAALSIAF